MRRGRRLAPRLLRLSRHINSAGTAAVGSSSRIFTGELPGFAGPKRKSGPTTRVLCLHASHKGSLVHQAAASFMDAYRQASAAQVETTEVDLWAEGALRYDLSHVQAKMNLIRGNGTEKDVASFTPVAQMAEQLVDADVLVVASPMWNYSCPHVLKHYM